MTSFIHLLSVSPTPALPEYYLCLLQRRVRLHNFAFQGLGTECADGEVIRQAKFTNERYCVGAESASSPQARTMGGIRAGFC